MKDDSLGVEHATLSGERIIPLGQRHTAGVPLPPEAPEPGRGAGANRQRWEQCSWSQGLERTCWESSCITWKKRRGMTIVEPQKHLQNQSTHFQSKRLPRSLQQNLLIFAGVLVSRANGSSFGVGPEYSVIEDRYRERVWRFSQLEDLL